MGDMLVVSNINNDTDKLSKIVKRFGSDRACFFIGNIVGELLSGEDNYCYSEAKKLLRKGERVEKVLMETSLPKEDRESLKRYWELIQPNGRFEQLVNIRFDKLKRVLNDAEWFFIPDNKLLAAKDNSLHLNVLNFEGKKIKGIGILSDVSGVNYDIRPENIPVELTDYVRTMPELAEDLRDDEFDILLTNKLNDDLKLHIERKKNKAIVVPGPKDCFALGENVVLSEDQTAVGIYRINGNELKIERYTIDGAIIFEQKLDFANIAPEGRLRFVVPEIPKEPEAPTIIVPAAPAPAPAPEQPAPVVNEAAVAGALDDMFAEKPKQPEPVAPVQPVAPPVAPEPPEPPEPVVEEKPAPVAEAPAAIEAPKAEAVQASLPEVKPVEIPAVKKEGIEDRIAEFPVEPAEIPEQDAQPLSEEEIAEVVVDAENAPKPLKEYARKGVGVKQDSRVRGMYAAVVAAAVLLVGAFGIGYHLVHRHNQNKTNIVVQQPNNQITQRPTPQQPYQPEPVAPVEPRPVAPVQPVTPVAPAIPVAPVTPTPPTGSVAVAEKEPSAKLVHSTKIATAEDVLASLDIPKEVKEKMPEGRINNAVEKAVYLANLRDDPNAKVYKLTFTALQDLAKSKELKPGDNVYLERLAEEVKRGFKPQPGWEPIAYKKVSAYLLNEKKVAKENLDSEIDKLLQDASVEFVEGGRAEFQVTVFGGNKKVFVKNMNITPNSYFGGNIEERLTQAIKKVYK